MTTKFFEEFKKASDGKFEMLKFASANYAKSTRVLEIKFIIDAFEMRKFTDDDKKEVQKICEQLFDGVKVSVVFLKSYADENVVKNKVVEFFNKNNQMIFRRLKDENLQISVDNSEILIKFTFEIVYFKGP